MNEDFLQPVMDALDPVQLVSEDYLEAELPEAHLLSRLSVGVGDASPTPTPRRRVRSIGSRSVTAIALAAAIASAATFAGIEAAAAGSNGTYAYPEAQARGELADALLQNYPQQYGGTDLVENGSAIDVYMTSVPEGFEALVAQYIPTTDVNVVTVAHSLLDLNSVADQIASAFSTLQASGIVIASTQVDFPSSTVIVNVVDLTNGEASKLDDEFGATNVTINSVPASATLGTSGALITEAPITDG
jgi:hypothetical protein